MSLFSVVLLDGSSIEIEANDVVGLVAIPNAIYPRPPDPPPPYEDNYATWVYYAGGSRFAVEAGIFELEALIGAARDSGGSSGTFFPTMSMLSGSATLGSYADWTWTRIGNVVSIVGNVELFNLGLAPNNILEIVSLPFPPSAAFDISGVATANSMAASVNADTDMRSIDGVVAPGTEAVVYFSSSASEAPSTVRMNIVFSYTTEAPQGN